MTTWMIEVIGLLSQDNVRHHRNESLAEAIARDLWRRLGKDVPVETFNHGRDDGALVAVEHGEHMDSLGNLDSNSTGNKDDRLRTVLEYFATRLVVKAIMKTNGELLKARRVWISYVDVTWSLGRAQAIADVSLWYWIYSPEQNQENKT